MMPKIFIVEDDPLMARLYERIFRLEKYTIEMAFDGQEAITKIEGMSEKPTLVLLDIMMPKLNGFEVLKYIKRHPELKTIPVIMLTNLAGKEDAERALELGAVLYLVKSQYEPREILQKVREVMEAYSRDYQVLSAPSVEVLVHDLPKK